MQRTNLAVSIFAQIAAQNPANWAPAQRKVATPSMVATVGWALDEDIMDGNKVFVAAKTITGEIVVDGASWSE